MLDGQINMTLSFGKKAIQATGYVKLIVPDQLVLSEAVRRELGIVNYHSSVKSIPRYTVEVAASLPNVESEDKVPKDTQALTSYEEVLPPTLFEGAKLDIDGKATEKKG